VQFDRADPPAQWLSRRRLKQRKKERGIRRSTRVLVLRVLDNADNLVVAAVLLFAHSETLADRISVRKEATRKGLVDDGNARRSRLVALLEGAALQQRRAERFEIVRSDAEPRRGRAGVIDSSSLDHWPIVPVVALKRAVGREASADDTGNLGKCGFELLVKRGEFFLCVADRIEAYEMNNDTSVGHETEPLAFEIAQVAGKQRGADQENNRQGDLRDDQRLLERGRFFGVSPPRATQSIRRI